MAGTPTKDKNVSALSALLIAVLSFAAFVGAASIVSKNQTGTTLFSSADEGNDDEDDAEEDEDEDEDEDDEEDDSSTSKSEEAAKKEAKKEMEAAKKAYERQLEAAKKQAELQKKSSVGSTDPKFLGPPVKIDDASGSDGSDDVAEADDVSDDENNEDDERAEVLAKIREEITEAREKILEEQQEGADVSVALARLAQAEAVAAQLSGTTFGTDDLKEMKRLATEAKKLAHFAREEDLHNAKEIAEDVTKILKRISQTKEKIASLETLGGETETFRNWLVEVETELNRIRSEIGQSGDTETIAADLEALERRVKNIKDAVENAIFALGGDNDDFGDDHKSEVALFVEQLHTIADIDESGIGSQVREVARAQHQSAERVDQLVREVEERGVATEFVFGPDYAGLDDLSEEIANNNVRIVALAQAATNTEDTDLKAMLVEQTEVLKQETSKLQYFVEGRLDQTSVLGWMFQLFR